MPTDAENRLSKCVENARCEKDKTEKECDLMKGKMKDLKRLLVCDMQMSDEELKNLVTEVEDYSQKMAKAEVQMKSTSSAFMAAHLATMEVPGVAGKVKYNKRFSKKGSRDVRCMLCFVVWYLTANEVCKGHILTAHWKVFEATVSISHKCFKFLYGNAIASASIFGFFIYENMSLSGRCHIVLFVYCRGRNKKLIGDVEVINRKIRMILWRQIREKEKQM